jgi:hypothetical protein
MNNMKISNLTVDKHSRLVGIGVHDAIVQAFRYEQGRNIDICLRDASGVDRWISLSNVARLGMRDIVNGTIISSIFCWELLNSPMQQIDQCEGWRVLLGGNYLESDLSVLTSNLRATYESKFFVFFESSYGGTIAAICEEIRFGEREDASLD